MSTHDLIIIGFGKAGKTLAAKMASQGKKVALIEQSPQMYGGTCINIGCIPTKTLITAADKGKLFDAAMADKTAVTTRLRKKNYDTMTSANVEVITGSAKFIANKEIEVKTEQGISRLTAETIIINTGAESVILPIKGLAESKHVFDSTGIQFLPTLPKKLGIIGGGNIGLEFASLFASLGTEVTVFDAGKRLLPREEQDIAELARNYLSAKNINFIFNANLTQVRNEGELVVVTEGSQDYSFDTVLYATGRKPNVASLNLEATDIKLTEKGAIQVNEYCETTVPNVFAVGDVNGGPQFTYISLDDFRIVFNYLNGNKDYSLKTRKAFPNTLFIDPPLSRIGLDATQAEQQGLAVKTKSLPVASMPKAHVNNDLRGVYKVVVDANSQLILGATLFGAEANELINLIKLAMDCDIPYTQLKNQIFSHPSMAENFNDLFNF